MQTNRSGAQTTKPADVIARNRETASHLFQLAARLQNNIYSENEVDKMIAEVKARQIENS